MIVTPVITWEREKNYLEKAKKAIYEKTVLSSYLLDKMNPSVKERFNKALIMRYEKNKNKSKLSENEKKDDIIVLHNKTSNSKKPGDDALLQDKEKNPKKKNPNYEASTKSEQPRSSEVSAKQRKRKFVIDDSDVSDSGNNSRNHQFKSPKHSETSAKPTPTSSVSNMFEKALESANSIVTKSSKKISLADRIKKKAQEPKKAPPDKADIQAAKPSVKKVSKANALTSVSKKHSSKVPTNKVVPTKIDKPAELNFKIPKKEKATSDVDTCSFTFSTSLPGEINGETAVPNKIVQTSARIFGAADIDNVLRNSETNLDNGGDNDLEAMEIDIFSEADKLVVREEEKMDWEVNEMRKVFEDSSQPAFLSGAVEVTSEGSWTTLTQGGQWVLVIDTNVFISALPFIERLLDINVPGLGCPVIYVPHRVLCELDAIKDSCKGSDVVNCARNAVIFLNKKLLDRHPRLRGQTLKKYATSSDLSILNSDDKILLSCLQVKDGDAKKRVILLSNDTNLRNKAIVEDVESFSVSEFETFLGNLAEDVNVKQMDASLLNLRMKALFKAAFEQILTSECRLRRPIAHLKDCLEFFVRRWAPWFSRFISVLGEEHLQRLREVLKNDDHLLNLMYHGRLFLRLFFIRGKPYFNVVKKTLSTLDFIRPHAEKILEPLPEEKDYHGSVDYLLNDVYAKVMTEIHVLSLANVNEAMRERAKGIEVFVSSVSSALTGLVKCSILDVSFCPDLERLAATLASCPGETKETYHGSLQRVFTTEAGQDLLEKAESAFRKSNDAVKDMMTRYAS